MNSVGANQNVEGFFTALDEADLDVSSAVSTPLTRHPSRMTSGGNCVRNAFSRSARWIVNCGAPYRFSAACAISSREVSSPVSHVRLMRWVGLAAVSMSAGTTPKPSSARTTFGVRLMSAPTLRNDEACSSTSTLWPAFRKAMAAASPPTPPPLIPILSRAISPACSSQRIIFVQPDHVTCANLDLRKLRLAQTA
jgi:hypothetical protein